jgi:hypothetical protein
MRPDGADQLWVRHQAGFNVPDWTRAVRQRLRGPMRVGRFRRCGRALDGQVKLPAEASKHLCATCSSSRREASRLSPSILAPHNGSTAYVGGVWREDTPSSAKVESIHQHRAVPPAVVALTAILAVAACGSPTQPVKSTPAPLAAPLLVQIENLDAARPQSGLSSASIVYEYNTEGGISRFTGIWFTPPPSSYRVGPVRSARLVSLRLDRIYGGVLLYSGASNYTQAQLNQSGLRWYNPNNAGSTLYRIASRPAPHNLYSDGGRLASFEQRVGMGAAGYQLWRRTGLDHLPLGGTRVTSFQVPVTVAERPIFTYDPKQHAYTRYEPGGDGFSATGTLADADTGRPWEVPNVVVLQVPVLTVSQDNENASNYPWIDGLDFNISGSGTGQLAVGGHLYSINWTQGESGPPQFHLSDGAAASLVAGQVLIELVAQGSTVTVPG